MLALFSATLFVSATLMFLVQPMFAKMVLPLLGGAPSVWNAEVVFCQGALLVGYLYAHLTVKWLGVRRQAILQGLMVFLPLLLLPIDIDRSWPPPLEGNPLPWLFWVLTTCLGLPFFVVATISPMLQRWFAGVPHPGATDPYFLYASSNAGSMFGLLGYLILVEPYFQLPNQGLLWSAGYGLLLVLVLACAALVLRSNQPGERRLWDSALSPRGALPLTFRRRMRWLLCALVPSSLMLSVTTYLSTNIAAVPLLWVIPLAVYLATLILVFARREMLSQEILRRAFSPAMLALVMVMILQATQPIWLLMPLHLVIFFTTAMVCHGMLARDRPPAGQVTEFYLWVSLGGILGGLFNVLLAPLLFPTLIEYPLMVVAAALLVAWRRESGPPEWNRWDWILPAALGILSAGLILLIQALRPSLDILMLGSLAVLCYFLSGRALRFALGIAALLLAGALYRGGQGPVLHRERDFFGVHRVQLDRKQEYHLLIHGGTLHGKQSLEQSRRCQPLSYYHREGPLGQLFEVLPGGEESGHRVAVVGLGAGSMAAYQRPGQQWIFYEIDPAVVRIAGDSRFFTYLSRCAGEVEIVLGDARLSLARETGPPFDLLILDAYSSDSIPVHLITREALKLYLQKTAPGGSILFHASNQYLDLKSVLGNLAGDAGLICLVRDDLAVSPEQRALGQEPSQWVVMTRRRENLGQLSRDPRWRRLIGSAEEAVWSDSYSSVLGVLRWSTAQ